MKETAGTLYIKIDRNTCVTNPQVRLSDIAKLECENQEILQKIKNIRIYHFAAPNKEETTHTTVSVSILKVIEMIHKIEPRLLVMNEGEKDFVIEYQSKQKKESVLDRIKTITLCIIIFFGSAFSIMSFNNDVDISGLFERFYFQVMGVEASGINVLSVCYSVGLALGITIFFNHIGSKKITHDPTPLQIEMRKYENDIDMTFIENASRKGHNVDVE